MAQHGPLHNSGLIEVGSPGNSGQLGMRSRATMSRAIRKEEESTDREIQGLKLTFEEMYGCA